MAQAAPTVMPQQAVSTTYAGFWIRFLAFLVDSFILGIIGWLLFGAEVSAISSEGASVTFRGWRALIPIAYTLAFWIWLAATPGKLICGLKIVEEDGKKLTWQKAILRYVGYFISAFGLFLGFIWVAFDSKKQGWHDKIAKTYVVHGRNEMKV